MDEGKTLLIQSCSATKNEVEGQVPAIDLYDGYFFRIIKKARRDFGLNKNLDMLILSAKHGIVRPDEEISHYDQVMDEERARELNKEVIAEIANHLEQNNYSKIVCNLGKEYRKAIEGLEDVVTEEHELQMIEGNGIGEKGKVLKEMVTGSSLENYVN
ncbi:MAG: DUF6884 domain-containing protein [Candidatus Nanohaloarchaea archaeon]